MNDKIEIQCQTKPWDQEARVVSDSNNFINFKKGIVEITHIKNYDINLYHD